MRTKTPVSKAPAEQVVKDIRRAAWKGMKPKIKSGSCLRSARQRQLCGRAGIVESFYYSWSKEFLEEDKRLLPGYTAITARPVRSKAFAARQVL